MKPLLKICGMTNRCNIDEILELKPDYLGFIFYSKSPRYVVGKTDNSYIGTISERTITTGVFVDEDIDTILSIAAQYGLRAVQLHGSESPQMCEQIKSSGLTVIKAFAVATADDFGITDKYKTAADYFLFDTKTEQHGGSGVSFDWKVLNAYKGSTPYFLSGGISPENIADACKTECYAIDINSRFEAEPGIKNTQLIKETLNTLTNN